jgi:nicotinamidase-related amidase
VLGCPSVADRTTALLILDMINPFDYEDGASLARAARSIAPAIAKVKARIKSTGGACVYINDNFGLWQSDFRELVVRAEAGAGAEVAEILRPDKDDTFILKPKHSAFFQTPLPLMLEGLGCRRLVVTGVAADACVLATALDAHMRDFEVAAPSNCIASTTKARKAAALLILKHADVDTHAIGG